MIPVVDEFHELAVAEGYSVFRSTTKPKFRDRVVVMADDNEHSVVVTADSNLGTVVMSVPSTPCSATVSVDASAESVLMLTMSLFIALGLTPKVYLPNENISSDEEALAVGRFSYDNYPW